MKSSPLKPILWLMALIMLVSLACTVGAAPTATQVPVAAAPTNTPPPPPTETVPPPPPTATETQAPVKPTTAPPTEEPPPPVVEEPALPANCIESDFTGFITCYDDYGSMVMDVPDYWTDVNGEEWVFEGEIIGKALSAAPSLSDFENSFTVEGVFFGASDEFARYGGYVQFLDAYTEIFRNDCDLVDRIDYDDGVYRGKYDQYEDCGGSGGYDAYVLSAVDIDDPLAMIVMLYAQVYPGDTITIEQIWATFLVLDL